MNIFANEKELNIFLYLGLGGNMDHDLGFSKKTSIHLQLDTERVQPAWTWGQLSGGRRGVSWSMGAMELRDGLGRVMDELITF